MNEEYDIYQEFGQEYMSLFGSQMTPATLKALSRVPPELAAINVVPLAELGLLPWPSSPPRVEV